MIILTFFISGLAAAILFIILTTILGVHDTASVIWLSTSLIIAFLCSCSAWIVKTIEVKKK